MTTDTLESTVTETAEPTSTEAAPDDRVEGLLATEPTGETATTAEETGQEVLDSEPEPDTGPTEPAARLKWLDEQYKAGHLTDEQIAERGSLRQQRDALIENRRKADQAREAAVSEKNELRPNFIARVIGQDDGTREYMERQRLAGELFDEVIGRAERVANADLEVEYRTELKSDLKSLGYGEAEIDEAVGSIKGFKDVLSARIAVRERVGQQQAPLPDEIKKLRDIEKKWSEIGGDDHYKKVIGDRKSERGQNVAPSSAGSSTAGQFFATEHDVNVAYNLGEIDTKTYAAEIERITGKKP